MTAERHIQERLEAQTAWFKRKSSFYQNMYRHLRLAEIVFAALIPLGSSIAVSTNGYERVSSIAIGLLGVAVASIAGILRTGQHQENRVNYRHTREQLKHQKFLFQTAIEPYNKEDAFRRFVRATEGILTRENSKWIEYVLEEES